MLAVSMKRSPLYVKHACVPSGGGSGARWPVGKLHPHCQHGEGVTGLLVSYTPEEGNTLHHDYAIFRS